MNTTIQTYIPDDFKQYVINHTAPVDKITPVIIDVQNGLVVPDKLNNSIGVFDENMNIVHESLRNRSNTHVHKPRRSKIKYINADAVYCGDGRMFHFGDFLLEGTAFIYPFLNKKYKNAKFVFCSPTIKKLPEYVWNILSTAGIEHDNIILATQPLRFNKVYIPQRSHDAIHGNPTSDTWKKTCQFMARNVKSKYKYDKVYVSRAGLGARRTLGEEHIQKIFAKNGYKIVYPEKLPFDKQIAMVKNCTHLAGCAGTALHLAMFMKPAGTVIQIKRNTGMIDNIAAQHVINKTVGLNFIFIWGSIESTVSEHFTPQPQIIGDTPYLRQFFDKNKFKYSDKDLQDTNAMVEYKKLLQQYNRKYAKTPLRKIRKSLVRIISNMIPYPGPRERVRHTLKRIMCVN